MTNPDIDTIELLYDVFDGDIDKVLALGAKYVKLALSREDDDRDNGEVDRYHKKVFTSDVVARKLEATGGIGPVALYGWEHRYLQEARLEAAGTAESQTIVIPLPRPTSDLLPA